MNKIFFNLIALGMFFLSISLSSKNSSLLKNRTALRMESKSLYKIIKEVGADSPESALQKVTGVQTLFDQLQVDSITQAVATIDNLRQEFKHMLSNLEQSHNNTLAILKNEQLLLESEKNKLLATINVDSIEKALEKFKQVQSTHEQITHFAQQLKN